LASKKETKVRIATMMLAGLIAACGSLATDAMAAEEIYRWVDENGEVHFGDLPPENTPAEQITIKPDQVREAATGAGSAKAATDEFGDPLPSYAQQLRDERAKKRQEQEEQKSITDEACTQRRQIVAQLEPSTRVMIQLEDGTVARMDDDERLKTLDEAKTYIEQNCKD
jgi:hypothetical protein